jgi:predicted Zn finger-like uncharacterized protein
MRLTCPNCGAQYAVDPSVIPDEGRDVQCSSCGHTWFQMLPAAEGADTAEPPAEEALPRRAPDPEVMSILREEADRERAARIAEGSSLESQTELDMPAPTAPAEPREKRQETGQDGAGQSQVAEAPALADPTDEERAHRAAPRRKTLPDIEEIDTTLTSGEEGDPGPVALAARRARERQGRRLGFGLAVGAFAAITLLYVQGDSIGRAVPAFEPALDAYTNSIDGARLWLDGALRAAVDPIAADTASSPEG